MKQLNLFTENCIHRISDADYFERHDKPYQREELERTTEERKKAREGKRSEYIGHNHHVTEAEHLLRHGYDPRVHRILKDGSVTVDP